MQVRKLGPTGDFLFGQGSLDFFQDVPEAVGQAVKTRLQLYLGEWFVDTSDGTDWNNEVLGYSTQGTRDLVIQDRVLGTPQLTQISGYASQFDGVTRRFTVQLAVDTTYGATVVSSTTQAP